MPSHKKSLEKVMNQKPPDNAEHYLAELFQMELVPNGSRMPDLRDGDFFLEVKSSSGPNARAQLAIYEMHYAMPKTASSPMFKHDNRDRTTYYDVIGRTDGLKEDDLKKPFSNVMLQWGDQYILPSAFITHMFAIQWYLRPNNYLSFDEIVQRLGEKMQQHAAGAIIRKEDDATDVSWQTVESHFIKSVFHQTPMKENSKKKYNLLGRLYSERDSLERITFNGPNRTKIYVLSEPRDVEYFRNPFSSKLKESLPLIEEISSMRQKATENIKNIVPIYSHNLFGEKFNGRYHINLPEEELALLKNLSVWKK